MKFVSCPSQTRIELALNKISDVDTITVAQFVLCNGDSLKVVNSLLGHYWEWSSGFFSLQEASEEQALLDEEPMDLDDANESAEESDGSLDLAPQPPCCTRHEEELQNGSHFATDAEIFENALMLKDVKK